MRHPFYDVPARGLRGPFNPDVAMQLGVMRMLLGVVQEELADVQRREHEPYSMRQRIDGTTELWTSTHVAKWIGPSRVRYEPPNPPETIKALVRFVRRAQAQK